MSTIDKTLVILCALFIGFGIALLQTYDVFRSVADVLVTVTGIASFLLAILEFFRKKE